MKRLRIVWLVAAALALVTPAFAGQIQVGYPGSPFGLHQTGQGGEFTLNDVNGLPLYSWLDLSGYSAQTSGLGGITSFQSFCIEKNEYIYPYAAVYEATLSGAAKNGGVAGGSGTPSTDPLSQGTAFLYSQFAQGVLTGYNYSSGSRSTSAAALQEAIWWLEQEVGSYTAGNIFIAQVAAQFGSAALARNDATGNRYGVSVLNLTAVSGAPAGVAQDQLYFQSVPDGGTTLLLLGLALLGMTVVSRRYRRA